MALKRGAIPSPRHVLAAATPYRAGAYPPAVLYFPKKLSMWLNDQDGDCVSAEEAFKMAAWSVKVGLPETFIPDQSVYNFAHRNGWLNGADLLPVMQAVESQGLVADDGKTYHNGAPNSVDYMSNDTLFSAIFQGASVKIGVAADQLENAVNSTNGRSGWVGFGWKSDNNEDHCTGLCGYGVKTSDLIALFAQAGVTISLPSGFSPTAPSVAFYTWDSIGIVDLPSVRNIMGEAWLRTPGTVEQPNVVPPPTPTPIPTPVPTPTPTPHPTPTPTPTPTGATGWWDTPNKTVHAPGYKMIRHPLPQFFIGPTIKEVILPHDWNFEG